MENLSEKEQRELSKKIERELKKDESKKRHEVKLLLLGAGESGKSTVAKQMKILHLHGFNEEERSTWKKIIHTNALASTLALIEGAQELKIQVQNQEAAQRIQAYCEGINEDTVDHFLDLTKELAADITALWADDGIQQAYAQRSKFQLDDSAKYFIQRAERLASDDYTPSDEDLLHARLRTTSVTEIQWVIDGTRFRMIDVGGQRGERSKWIHQFEDVTAIIFVVGISEYDQVIREDGKTNRLHEAIQLFETICTNRWLVNKPIILFLNKKDLFAEKIKNVGLKVCFKEYKGKNEYKDATNYIEKKFTEIANECDTKLFPHLTCATDTENVLHVWDAVKHITLGDILRTF